MLGDIITNLSFITTPRCDLNQALITIRDEYFYTKLHVLQNRYEVAEDNNRYSLPIITVSLSYNIKIL